MENTSTNWSENEFRKKIGIWSYIEMLYQSVHLKEVWIKTVET